MKLLLTSNGLCNDSISNAFFELVGKDPGDTIVTFIPTASNVVNITKTWFVNDLTNITKHNIKKLNIADISAIPEKIWLPQFEEADVLFFSGGNSTHLMYHLQESGLQKMLPDLLKTKVYTGISAGSIVATPSLALSSDNRKEEYKELFRLSMEEALGLVNFHVRPHLNSEYFPDVRKDVVAERAKIVPEPVYAIDDETAIKVDGDKIEIISEGEYHILTVKNY